MKGLLLGLIIVSTPFVANSAPEIEIDSNDSAVKLLIPFGGEKAVWESECKYAMK